MKNEVKFLQRFSFISYIAAQKLMYMLISGFATIYYISYLKMDPLLVASIIFTTRLFDAVNDPLIGITIDRLKFKFKSYTNIVSFLLPLATIFVFNAPKDAGLTTVIYVIVSYVIWSLLYTIGEVPIYAIVMRLTKSINEQNYLFSISQVGSIGGVVIGLVLTVFFVSGGVEVINWQIMSLVFAVFGFTQMIGSIFFLKEKYIEEKQEENEGFSKVIKKSLSNKQLYIIMFIYMSQMFMNASAVLSIYVFEGYYNLPSLGSIMALISMVLIFPIAFLIPKIVKTYGKTNLMYLAGSLMIISNLLVILIPNINLLVIMAVISSVSVIVPSLLRPMYIQECILHQKQKTNYTSEATAFSIMTFFNKTGDAIGATLGTLVLSLIGFDQNLGITEQSFEIISSARIIYFLGPVMMGICWIVGLKYFYGLKNQKSIEMNIELNKENYEISS